MTDDRDQYVEAVKALRSAGEVAAAAAQGMFREGIVGLDASPRDPGDPPPASLEVGFEEVTRLGAVIDDTADHVLLQLEVLEQVDGNEMVREAIDDAGAEWLYEHVFRSAYASVRLIRERPVVTADDHPDASETAS